MTCNEGDVCSINCGKYSCDSSGTMLYWYGNSLIVCDSNETDNDCVHIVVSASPMKGLTKVQVSNAITQENVSLLFN